MKVPTAFRVIVALGLLSLAGCGSGSGSSDGTGKPPPAGSAALKVEVSDELAQEGLTVKESYKTVDGGGITIRFEARQDFGGGKFTYTSYDSWGRVLKEGTLPINNISKGNWFAASFSDSELKNAQRIVIQTRAKETPRPRKAKAPE